MKSCECFGKLICLGIAGGAIYGLWDFAHCLGEDTQECIDKRNFYEEAVVITGFVGLCARSTVAACCSSEVPNDEGCSVV